MGIKWSTYCAVHIAFIFICYYSMRFNSHFIVHIVINKIHFLGCAFILNGIFKYNRRTSISARAYNYRQLNLYFGSLSIGINRIESSLHKLQLNFQDNPNEDNDQRFTAAKLVIENFDGGIRLKR